VILINLKLQDIYNMNCKQTYPYLSSSPSITVY